jgi:SNF2 family DNA or RNA helicase
MISRLISKNSYINTISGNRISKTPDEFRGGILADMMGLGKTLSAIALIASDKDNNRIYRPLYTDAEHVNTTLVIVRAPCKQVLVMELLLDEF